MIIQLILVLAASLITVMFAFQNPHYVQMQFMAWQSRQFPVIVVILVSALAGVILTALLSLKNTIEFNRRIRELRTDLDAARRGGGEKADAAGSIASAGGALNLGAVEEGGTI